MLDADEIDRQNALWRIDEYGPGAELVRQYEVERLQELMKPFYSYGSLIDIFVLRIALESEHRVKDVTIQHDLYALSVFFRKFAVKRGWSADNPVRGVTKC